MLLKKVLSLKAFGSVNLLGKIKAQKQRIELNIKFVKSKQSLSSNAET